MGHLTPEDIVTLNNLAHKGLSNRAIAGMIGCSEGAIRYQINKAKAAEADAKVRRPFKADAVADAIKAVMDAQQEADRPVNVQALYEDLVTYHGFDGSYRAVLRYVRAHYPPPKRRTFRRVETPPGAQVQTDWAHFKSVPIGHDLIDLNAFLMVLSHSRKTALVWSQRMDMLSWLRCHNEAFARLGGIAAVNRIDNLKTGVLQGAGAWGVLNPTYQTYARQVGFHVDLCPPRAGNAKGKVEARVRLGRLRLTPRSTGYDSLEHLQHESDETLRRYEASAICPVTGQTVEATWQQELERLRPLPVLPEPFDVAVERSVYKDATIQFEGRTYSVPFAYAYGQVEVRGCASTVEIWADGQCLQTHPRGTEARLLVDATCYDGPDTDTHRAPPPLGKMGQRLQDIMDMPVEQRPLDLYAALAEVAR